MNLPLPGHVRTVSLSILAALLGGSPAFVRAEEKDEPVALEHMVITGTNIPMAADTVAVPVTILGAREIEKTGLSANLLEIVRKGMPFFSGNSNLGNTNANTAGNTTSGGSQASLRNLDTLVLINGRRVSTSGAGGRGGRNFVDLNLIPVAAIESVEVLSDGASAIYGSDAVGGVINIKLKHDLNGGAVGVRFGLAKSGYNETSAFAVAGANSPASSLTVAVSWSKTDPLLQKDRPFSEHIFGKSSTVSGAEFPGTTAFPGYGTVLLSPNLNSPRQQNPVGTAATATTLSQLVANGTYSLSSAADIGNAFDIAPYVTLLIGQEQKAIVLDHSVDLSGKHLQLFDDFIYAHNDGRMQLAAQGVSGIRVLAGSPYNPLTVDFPGVGFRYLPAPRFVHNDADFTRATLGFRGELGRRWNWETGYVYSKNRVKVTTENLIYSPNVALAVAGGYDAQGNPSPGGAYSRVAADYGATNTFVIQPALDAFARPAAMDRATLNHVLGTGHLQLDSSLKTWDAKISGEAVDLPAGPLGVAAGVVYARDSLSGQPDDNTRVTVARWSGIATFEPFASSRHMKAAFAEARVPIASSGRPLPALHALDLSLAYRMEDYSDAGQSKVPKYGLRWQPIDDQLTFRYTYSRSFTVPSLYLLSGPGTQGTVSSTIMRSIFGSGVDAAQARFGPNPDLKPSTAKSHSIGFVFSPKAVPGLTFSVDYIHIDQTNLVNSIGSGLILQNVDQLGPQSPYVRQVAFDAFPGEPNARSITKAGELTEYLRAGNLGSRIFVSDRLVNASGAKVNAVDVNLNYLLTTSVGKFEFTTTGTFDLDYKVQALPSEPFYEYAGTATVGGSGSEGTLPGYRFYSTVSYRKGPWETMIGHTYIPGVVDLGTGGQGFATSTSLQRRPVDSFQAWDAQISYTIGKDTTGALSLLRNLKFTVGVNNVFDEMPPVAKQAFVEANADIATYGAVGRLVFASAQLRF